METTNTTETAAPSYFDGLRAAAFDATVAMLVESSPTIASIMSAALPASFISQPIRHLDQKERTTCIRSLLRSCGVLMGARGKGVSVKAATGSMCYWTKVRYENVSHADGTGHHNQFECATCTANRAASAKVSALILEAFPDLDNRSDSMTDHSDFVFTIN